MKFKKFFSLSVLLILSLISLVGCKGNSSKDKIMIGINQFTEHPALDDVRKGFEEGLKEFGDFDINFINAQGDITNTISISEKFVSDNKDLIFAIGTPSAQSSKQVTENLPIVFSAVTDPVETGLVESFTKSGTNLVGTSDQSPIKKQLSLFKELDSSIKTIGIIYNTSEINSTIQIKNTKIIAKELGLKVETIGIANINDIAQATDSIIKKVDGIYTITDNMVASAIPIVAQKANENKIITIGSEESHIKSGILMTNGISYFELGKQSARMAKEILIDKKDISTMACQKAENTFKVFNKNTLETLGLNINNIAFKDATEINN